VTIRYSKKFVKQLAKQPEKVQKAFYLRVKLFEEDPNEPLLNAHRLKGKMSRFHSINVTGDVRALYEVAGDDIYVYEMVGTHSQLYG
jgi:addiction module RelE/StbE family toxin